MIKILGKLQQFDIPHSQVQNRAVLQIDAVVLLGVLSGLIGEVHEMLEKEGLVLCDFEIRHVGDIYVVGVEEQFAGVFGLDLFVEFADALWTGHEFLDVSVVDDAERGQDGDYFVDEFEFRVGELEVVADEVESCEFFEILQAADFLELLCC